MGTGRGVTTLLRHGKTPTGVGLTLDTTGISRFVLTTPCCGVPFWEQRLSDGMSSNLLCKSCGLDHKGLSRKLKANFVANFAVRDTDNGIVLPWLRRATGLNSLEVIVDNEPADW